MYFQRIEMNSFVLLFVSIAMFNVEGFSRKNVYPKIKTSPIEGLRLADVGEPLFVTPLINAGKIEEARQLSLVKNLTSVVSYSGYFTVNETNNSNMFYWFFPAAFNTDTAPVVLWLQGGPGGTSMFGLFVENGPFIIDANNNIQFRSTAWSLTHSVLYLDNPVGTDISRLQRFPLGFSFTEDDKGYARTEDDVADGLYSAMTQFFTLFPMYQARDFFATGESYAGKYVPAITHRIHTENQNFPKVKINLKGMAIGDGFSDPENMLNYGDYLYNIGLLDRSEKNHFREVENRAKNFIKNKQFVEAFKTIDELLDGDLISGQSYFKNCTGFDFYFNFLMTSQPKEMEYYDPFLQQPYVRRSIHVGNKTFNDGSAVEKGLMGDMYRSVAPLIVDILDAPERYKVLFYNGQLDIIVANVLTENFLHKLSWHGKQSWEAAERKVWKVGTDIAGYVKVEDNLTYLLVRNAGHIVPFDQPKHSFDLINRFTSSKPFA